MSENHCTMNTELNICSIVTRHKAVPLNSVKRTVLTGITIEELEFTAAIELWRQFGVGALDRNTHRLVRQLGRYQRVLIGSDRDERRVERDLRQRVDEVVRQRQHDVVAVEVRAQVECAGCGRSDVQTVATDCGQRLILLSISKVAQATSSRLEVRLRLAPAVAAANIITNVVSTHHSRAQISYDAEKGLWSSINPQLIRRPWVALLFMIGWQELRRSGNRHLD